MRIGLACPYTWDVPGGVQVHVRDLAESLMRMGHEVSVITPIDDEDRLPPYAVSAGKAMSVPYNGSVTRILFGPVSASRVRRWIRDGEFDVVHAHEPTAPSTSLLACLAASGPLPGRRRGNGRVARRERLREPAARLGVAEEDR